MGLQAHERGHGTLGPFLRLHVFLGGNPMHTASLVH